MSATSHPTRSRSARLALPEGTLPVGLALLIAGIASYAFFVIGKRTLGAEEFKPVASLWFLTFLLAPGFFLPLEQELGRALAHRRALVQGGRPVVRRIVVLGAALVSVVSIAILAVSPFLTSELFSGDWALTVALITAFVCYAPAHLSRGVCSGTGRFGSYAVVMGSDGVMRVLACSLFAVAGVKVAAAYGFAVALAPLAGIAIVALRGSLHTEPGPAASWSEVTPNLGWLLAGSVLAAALVNAGPLTVDLLASPSQDEAVTTFANAVLIARVPLFLFQAVQAALLPRLARLAASGDFTEFRAGFRRLMLLVFAVGFTGTVGAFLVGPIGFEVVFDSSIERRTITLLALGSACYMVALATAQAVIALHGHALVALGWMVGMTGFVVVTALAGHDIFLRVELGLVAGAAAAMVTFALSLRARMLAGATFDSELLLEAVTDVPFDA